MFSSASTAYKGSVSSNVLQKVVLFSQTRQLIIDTLSYESNRKFNCKWYEKMLLHPPNSVLCTCKPRTDGKAKHLEEKHGFDWFHISSRNKSQLTFTAKQHGQLYPQKTKVLFCKKSFDGFHSKTQTFLPGIKASWPLLLNNTDNCIRLYFIMSFILMQGVISVTQRGRYLFVTKTVHVAVSPVNAVYFR